MTFEYIRTQQTKCIKSIDMFACIDYSLILLPTQPPKYESITSILLCLFALISHIHWPVALSSKASTNKTHYYIQPDFRLSKIVQYDIIGRLPLVQIAMQIESNRIEYDAFVGNPQQWWYHICATTFCLPFEFHTQTSIINNWKSESIPIYKSRRSFSQCTWSRYTDSMDQ